MALPAPVGLCHVRDKLLTAWMFCFNSYRSSIGSRGFSRAMWSSHPRARLKPLLSDLWYTMCGESPVCCLTPGWV